MKVFGIRHGETEWSPRGQHTGPTDIPLVAKQADVHRFVTLLNARGSWARWSTRRSE